MLQLQVSVPENIQASAATATPILKLVLIGVAIYAVVFVIALIVRKIMRRRHRETIGFHKIVLSVTVPKETLDTEAARKETSIQEIRERLGAAESLFSVIGGVGAEKGLKAWFVGRSDELAFEIAVHDGLVHFYVAVPPHLKDLVEEQIHANYPHAEIEEIEDYNIFTPQGAVAGAYLTFKRYSYFPIKTYQKLDIDPLSNITNSLATIGVPDGAAVQIVVRPTSGDWRKHGVKIASLMHQGKSLDEAAHEARGRGKLIKELKKGFSKQSDQPEKERKLSPLEEEMAKGIEEKASKAGLEANIRIVASGLDQARADKHLADIINAWSQFNIYQYGNSFQRVSPSSKNAFVSRFIYRSFEEKKKMILNAEEMASIYHMPGQWIQTPNIHWLLARHAPPPVNLPAEGIILGRNEYRGIKTIVRFKRNDRRQHFYEIGRSGTGKSFIMEQMAAQDIQNGDGVCIVDPHGEFAEAVLASVPPERADDVIYFDPSDVGRPVGLNMLDPGFVEQRDMAAQEMVSIFYELFGAEMIGPIFEHQMRNVMLTLMADVENPGSIAEIPRMFTDPDFQKLWIKKVTDPVVRAFWEKEMSKVSDFHKSEQLGYIISKVGRFVENDLMRNIIGQTHSSFNFREIMDKKKILVINLAKGKIGDVNSKLLGLIIVSKLTMAALSRSDEPDPDKRPDFYLYIDEFQNYITESITTILSEARKYRLCLNIAHQYLGQLAPKGDTKIRDAVLGNAGTILVYRIGIEDAKLLESEFSPTFSAFDLVNIASRTAYIKLLIDGTGSKPFNLHTYRIVKSDPEIGKALIELSRLKYGRDRAIVEAEIAERAQIGGGTSELVEMKPQM